MKQYCDMSDFDDLAKDSSSSAKKDIIIFSALLGGLLLGCLVLARFN